MHLSVEPNAKRTSGQLARLILVILIGSILLWWQRDRLIANSPSATPRNAASNAAQVTNASLPDTSEETQTKAFTADFYEADAILAEAMAKVQGIQGRTNLEQYTIQSGDTLWGIAVNFGLDIDTIRWANPDLERNPDLLVPGKELTILPVLGVYHEISDGDTLDSIAEQFGVEKDDILDFPLNAIVSETELRLGQKLVIPNGRKDLVRPAPELDTEFVLAWPMVGPITQGFSEKHLAVDVGAPYGSLVYASEAGKVVYAQWAQTGYGFTVIIEHDNHLKTLYSHLKGALVQQGVFVERGQAIGEVGSTGNSTGPHVHFEVREDGQRVNPLAYLK